MRSADRVTLYNIRGKPSWSVLSKPARYPMLILLQLDAGMHPAYDGLSALPFYDDFDLGTVDVLLISQ